MTVIAYNNQTPDFFRRLSQAHDEVLICLNSGDSFRKKIEAGYIPNPEITPKFNRLPGTRFQRWSGTEAEDLKFLWTVKYIGNPEQSLKSICKKILIGNPDKRVPTLLHGSHFLSDILPKISLKWTTPQAMDFISKELDINHNDVSRNFYLTARNMELYRTRIEDFDKLYKLL